jgi:hypothetical protein
MERIAKSDLRVDETYWPEGSSEVLRRGPGQAEGQGAGPMIVPPVCWHRSAEPARVRVRDALTRRSPVCDAQHPMAFRDSCEPKHRP